MPKLVLPQQVNTGQYERLKGADKAIAGAADLGKIQATSGANAVEQAAKIGQITSDKAASAMAGNTRIGQITMNDLASAAASYANIGQSASALGKSVFDLGNQYFSKAANSIGNSLFNQASSDASAEYNGEVQERDGLLKDGGGGGAGIGAAIAGSGGGGKGSKVKAGRGGTASFATYGKDIQEIGDRVQSKYASRLTGDNQARFNKEFGDYRTNTEIGALQKARTAQLQFANQSLQKGIEADVNNAGNAGSDRGQLDFHYNLGKTKLDKALTDGTIDPVTHAKSSDALRRDIYVKAASDLNRADPSMAGQWLQSIDPKDPVITPLERRQLEIENVKALKDQQVKMEAAERLKELRVKNQQNFINNELEVGITKGSVGEADIDRAYQTGRISQEQWSNNVKALYSARKSEDKNLSTMQDITNKINTKAVLTGISPSAINKHYNDAVNEYRTMSGNEPTMIDKAAIAAHYKGHITDFTTELKGNLVSGTAEQAVQAAQAYSEAQTRNPLSTMSADNKTRALASYIQAYKSTNVDPNRIVEAARQNILNVDADTEKQRSIEFNKVFKDRDDVIDDIYDNGQAVSRDVKDRTLFLLREAYLENGDEKAAIQTVKNQVAGRIGPSEVNNGDETIMYMPPEKVYQLSAQELRNNLNNDPVAKQLGLKYGIDPNTISVKSDEITQLQVDKTKNGQPVPIDYRLYTKDEQGNEINLFLDNGQPARWHPGRDEIAASRQNSLKTREQDAYKAESQLRDVKENPFISGMNIFKTYSERSGIDAVMKEYGISGASNKDIVQSSMFKSQGIRANDDTAKYNKMFIDSILNRETYGSITPQSFLTAGTPTTTPTTGDVAVFNIGGKEQVGLFGGFKMEGGIKTANILSNTGSGVSLSQVPESAVRGYRVPPMADDMRQQMEGVVPPSNAPIVPQQPTASTSSTYQAKNYVGADIGSSDKSERLKSALSQEPVLSTIKKEEVIKIQATKKEQAALLNSISNPAVKDLISSRMNAGTYIKASELARAYVGTDSDKVQLAVVEKLFQHSLTDLVKTNKEDKINTIFRAGAVDQSVVDSVNNVIKFMENMHKLPIDSVEAYLTDVGTKPSRGDLVATNNGFGLFMGSDPENSDNIIMLTSNAGEYSGWSKSILSKVSISKQEIRKFFGMPNSEQLAHLLGSTNQSGNAFRGIYG